MSIEWNSIRLGGPAHGIVTKTVHKTLPGGGGGPGGGWVGVVGVQGWMGRGWWVKVAEFPKLALKHGILLNLPI